MTRLSSLAQLSISVLCAFLFIALATAQSCNTDQNPYCRGNDELEQLCCPYPNVCYWQRGRIPSCCAAGQVCLGEGGYITPQPIVTPTPEEEPEPEPEPSTITSYITQPNNGGGGGVIVVTETDDDICNNGCHTITSYAGGAWDTVTSEVGGAFSTVTSNIAGGYQTVTSTVGQVATDAATDIVQVINGKASIEQARLLWVVAGACGCGLWLLA
jgi:hypothetical protein